jgi:phage shock protein PspC (stress-responsive transcriptional regulator)
MKKTVQVNLSGQIFTLDDDAYQRLSAYLNQIGRLYSNSPGKDEILQDIEVRIAELFHERLGENRMVVALNDVYEVIEIMGRPEQFDEESTENDAGSQSQDRSEEYRSKRLYRDPDDKVVGGVCSGVGYYFGIDPIFIRLAFVFAVIMFGSGVLFYLILMVVLPEAKTASEKRNMRGEPVNLSGIGKSIENEINAFGERISKDGGDFGRNSGKKLVRGIDRFFYFLAELIRNIFGVIGKFLGILFILIGTVFVASLIAGLFGIADVIHFSSHSWSASMDLYEWGGIVFDSTEWLAVSVTAFLLLIGIPFLALAYGGYLLLFPRNRVPYLGMSLFGLWFLGLIFAIFSGFGILKSFSESDSIVDEFHLEEVGLEADTIIVSLGEDPFNIEENRAYRANKDFMIKIDEEIAKVGKVEFTILPATNEHLVLELLRESNGSTFESAASKASNIDYHFVSDDKTLKLNSFFSFPTEDLLRDQAVELKLLLPVGKTVFLDRSALRVIYDIPNVTDMNDQYMVDHYWRMEEKGLVCLDCDSRKKSESLEIEARIGLDTIASIKVN